jgi:GNAT superfamily N-acetyltransferase
MNVRVVHEEEWQRVRELRLRALGDAPYAFASSAERERDMPEKFWRERLARRSEDGVTLVAEDDAGWWGMVGAFVAEDGPRAVHLVAMWVDPNRRRRGIGRELVDSVAAWARDRGADELFLWVTETNEPAARLYGSMGFRPSGQRQPLPSDPSLSEMQMVLALGPTRAGGAGRGP